MKFLTVAVCYFYKEQEYLQNDACIPIQVGYDETLVDMGIQKDNEGDCRAEKHPYYSELSGLYWIWKNVNSEYKGLFHHRRAFTLRGESISTKLYHMYRIVRCVGANFFKYKMFFNLHQVRVNEIEYKKRILEFLECVKTDVLGKYDMIVPVPAFFWPTCIRDYFSVIEYNIFNLVGDIIRRDWSCYEKFWNKTISGRSLYYANISIMRSDLFELYCTFMFGVFDKLEDLLIKDGFYISLSKEKFMSRRFGYLGELLTNTFILCQKEEGVKIKELCVLVNSDAKYWGQ